jgi:HD-GYP domain-containing protein (c-di-GMP phosphodiesterase class II)
MLGDGVAGVGSMWSGDQLLGIVLRKCTDRREARATAGVQLVESLAALAAVALAKARAVDLEQQRMHDNELLVRSVRAANHSPHDSQVNDLAEQAALAVASHRSGIWIVDGDSLKLAGSFGVIARRAHISTDIPLRAPLINRVRLQGDHLEAWALGSLDDAAGAVLAVLGFGEHVLVQPVYGSSGFNGMIVLEPGTFHASEREVTLIAVLAGQVANTADRTRMLRSIDKRSRHLASTPRLARSLARQRDPDAVARIAARELHETFGYARVSIALSVEERLRISASAGLPARSPAAIVRTPVLDRLAEHGRPYVSCARDEHTGTGTARSRIDDANAPNGCRSQVVVPILDGAHSCIGAIAVYECDPDGISEDDLHLLQTIADQLAGTLEQSVLFETLERNWMRTVEALSAALEAKDAYTLDHARSITDLSAEVGSRLGMRGDDLRDLKLAALLHDIGKIGVPGEILNKQGPLNDEEFEVMKQHTIIGEQIIAPIEFLEGVRPMVLHEHERWDGRGYPHGLRGEDIPLGARIIFVCDAWHAMTSDRPYRQALPEDEARRRLRAGAGSQFDPAVVDAFVDVLDGQLVGAVRTS